jgi:hypothetical protein
VLRLAACAPTLAAALALVVGCGNERAGSSRLFDAPDDEGTQRLRYPQAGLAMVLPRPFVVSRAKSPQVFRASLEDAFVSSFAYPRDEQLPTTTDQLRTARDRLVEAAEERDRSFRLMSSKLTRAAGSPAIELLGEQTISMGRLRLRSLHVYKGNAEYVVELGAPVAGFRRIDRSTFPAVRRSLKVTGRVKKAPAKKAPPRKRKAGDR